MKPEYLRKPSTFFVHKNVPDQAQQPLITYLNIYEEAKLKKHWIYDPQIKRWQTPEEFLELEKRYSGGETDRLTRLQVRDPVEGINAGNQQIQELKENQAKQMADQVALSTKEKKQLTDQKNVEMQRQASQYENRIAKLEETHRREVDGINRRHEESIVSMTRSKGRS